MGARTVLSAPVIVVVIHGYQLMLLVDKVVVLADTALVLLGLVAYATLSDASYDPGPEAYALGGLWPTSVLSALIVMGDPVGSGAFLGDWSRYVPADTRPSRLMGATFLGQLATLVPFPFGWGRRRSSPVRPTTSSR